MLDGRYQLQHLLGSGGMSDVYAARDLLLERCVAIKTLKVELSESGYLERLRREAAAMARVESPHVVSIHDIRIGDDGVYLVMQYVHGLTIEQDVERFGPMAPARACRVAIDLLSGLSAIHSHGLVHRDLKPSNVVLDRDDRAVLLDLGVALHRRKHPMTPHGMAAGTPEFMAPEQLEAAPLDGRTDLYQLGRIIVYLVTGRDAETDVATGLAQMPPALAAIARRAMAPLGKRYRSTEQMRTALAELEHTPRTPNRRRWSKWPLFAATVPLFVWFAALAAC